MATSCAPQQYDYPPTFIANGGQQVTFAQSELVPLIAHAYANYFVSKYGTDTSKWPATGQPYVKDQSMPAGYTLMTTFTDGQDNTPIGFWCYKQNEYLVLVFRGTEGWIEWTEDALIAQDELTIATLPNENLGCVHSGFLQTFQKMSQTVGQALESLPEAAGLGETPTVYITGHSLGAAVATLASLDLHAWNIATYTFGCPRVGSPTFATAYDKIVPNSFRITNGWDIIPPMPPVMVRPFVSQSVYQHTGGECPLYTSAFEFANNVQSDPFYGHHLSTYNKGLTDLISYLNQSMTEVKPTASRADAATSR